LSRGKRTRLTDSPDFERVYRQGTAYRGKLFSVHAFPNEFGTPRLGLSVSRRVGNAVMRNAVRRRLREVFYSVLPEIPSNLDLVVSARPAAAEATFQELGEEFVRALGKLGESREAREGEPRSRQ
jgi:ribonuclease P protein component